MSSQVGRNISRALRSILVIGKVSSVNLTWPHPGGAELAPPLMALEIWDEKALP